MSLTNNPVEGNKECFEFTISSDKIRVVGNTIITLIALASLALIVTSGYIQFSHHSAFFGFSFGYKDTIAFLAVGLIGFASCIVSCIHLNKKSSKVKNGKNLKSASATETIKKIVHEIRRSLTKSAEILKDNKDSIEKRISSNLGDSAERSSLDSVIMHDEESSNHGSVEIKDDNEGSQHGSVEIKEDEEGSQRGSVEIKEDENTTPTTNGKEIETEQAERSNSKVKKKASSFKRDQKVADDIETNLENIKKDFARNALSALSNKFNWEFLKAFWSFWSQSKPKSKSELKSEKEQEILKNAMRDYKSSNASEKGITIHSGGDHDVFEIESLPGLIFKIYQSDNIEEHKAHAIEYVRLRANSDKACQQIKEERQKEGKGLLLYSPACTYMEIDGQYVIIEERVNGLDGEYSFQKGLFRWGIANEKLKPYFKELFLQLLLYSCKMKFSDLKYNNIPINPSTGKCCLIDNDSNDVVVGLTRGRSAKESEGLLNYIPEEWLTEFMQVAKQHLSSDDYAKVSKKVNGFLAEDILEVVKDYLTTENYGPNENIEENTERYKKIEMEVNALSEKTYENILRILSRNLLPYEYKKMEKILKPISSRLHQRKEKNAAYQKYLDEHNIHKVTDQIDMNAIEHIEYQPLLNSYVDPNEIAQYQKTIATIIVDELNRRLNECENCDLRSGRRFQIHIGAKSKISKKINNEIQKWSMRDANILPALIALKNAGLIYDFTLINGAIESVQNRAGEVIIYC